MARVSLDEARIRECQKGKGYAGTVRKNAGGLSVENVTHTKSMQGE